MSPPVAIRSMKPTCPRCRKPIPPDQISMATATVHCPPCGEIFAIPDLLSQASEPVDLANLPKGLRYEEWAGGFRATVSQRSCVIFFLVPFTVVWAGGSLSGIYGTQIARGKFDLGASLFGIPFLLGSLVLTGLCLFMLFGYSAVESSGGTGRVSRGIGPVRWHRRFASADVTGIEFQPRSGETAASAALLLADGRRVPIGLPPDQQRATAFIAVLRHAFFGKPDDMDEPR